MNNPFGKILPSPEDTKRLQIVQKLMDQTRSRKLIWVKKGVAYEAFLKGGTHVAFVAKELQNVFLKQILQYGGKWAQFSVKRRDGSEILKVEATNLLLGVTTPTEGDPLQEALDELFALVEERQGEDLDQVLSELE